jgi:xylulokinase
MSEPAILAVDLGTSSMKVGLVTLNGDVIGWEAEPIQVLLTPDGGVEQSPEGWWQAFLTASKRLLKGHPGAPRSLLAVCCSTQGEGTIPVDHAGQAR